MVGLAPALLALVFGIHITMVNLGIGLSWLVPYLKWRADRGEGWLEAPARSLMKFYAATYGVAGVFGTAFTVFLLSYYPHFIGFAGDITMAVFGIAIVMIALHFFSIVAYWYGWDRWGRRTHHFIGLLLGVSALLIPLGFRAIFAFLNIPAGLGYSLSAHKFYLDTYAAIADNPTFLPLYLKSIDAAFAATFLVVLGAYAYRSTVSRGAEREASLRLAKMMVKPAVAALAAMAILGPWYAVSLESVPYKFNNIFAPLGWSVDGGTAYYNVSWLFVLKMALVAFQVAALAYAAPKLLRGGMKPLHARALLYAGLAAIAGIAAGEYLNAFSQYPFFIAVWPDVLAGHVPLAKLASYGISIPKQALPTVIEAVDGIVLLDSTATTHHILARLGIARFFPETSAVNTIAVRVGVVALTAAFLAFLLASTAYFIYMILVPPGERRTAVELEEEA